MEERLPFVARLLDGEAMTDICRNFGVSRKTGYKIFDRYREHGLEESSICVDIDMKGSLCLINYIVISIR